MQCVGAIVGAPKLYGAEAGWRARGFQSHLQMCAQPTVPSTNLQDHQTLQLQLLSPVPTYLLILPA